MIGPDFKWPPGTFEVHTPMIECVDDGKELLVEDVVISFGGVKGFGEVSDWVPAVSRDFLR